MTRALTDIDLSFIKGSFCSIIGQSGSGKSTLLNIIGTLDRPTSGTLEIGGKRVERMTKNELAILRNNDIGFIFQFHYLLPEFTAIENVLMPHWISGKKDKDKARERAEHLLETVGLEKLKDKTSRNMSGGQQQRVAVARALMNNPKIILADEPTGNLDSENSDKLLALFKELNEKFGTTTLLVTHNKGLAEETERIVELKDGRVSSDVRK